MPIYMKNPNGMYLTEAHSYQLTSQLGHQW